MAVIPGGYRAASPPAPDAPPRVAEADAERTIHQVFGRTKGALVWALSVVVAAIVLVILSVSELAIAPIVAGGMGIAGLISGLLIELLRRSRRVSIVLMDERVLVYGNGALAGTMDREQLMPYHLHGLITYRFMFGWFGLAFCGLMGLFAGLGAQSVVGFLLAASLLTASLLGLTSSYQTRSMCRHYWVGPERVMFRLRDLQNVAVSVRWFSVA